MKKILAFVAAALLISTVTVFAGTTQNVDVDIEIPTLLTLAWSVDGSSIQATGANKITEAEYIAGSKDAIAGGTFDVYANTAWDLTVAADANNFAGGSNAKPVSDLRIDVDSLSAYPFALNGLTPVVLYTNQPAVQPGFTTYSTR